MGGVEIKAGKAYVELAVVDRLGRGLAKAAAKLKAFGATIRNAGLRMMTLGASIVAPLLGAAKTYADMGHELEEMSKRTGFSVEALSELSFAAEQSGTSIDVMEKAFKRVQVIITAAGRGTVAAKKALANLGLTFKDLEGLDPEKQFLLIMQQLSKMPNPTMRAATAFQLFGRSGTQLLPMIENGIVGLEALRQKARDFGLVISQEDAQKASEFKDTLNLLWRVMKQGVFVIGSALAPTLKEAAIWLAVHIKRVSDWLRQNKGLVVSILKLAVGLVAAGVGLTAFGFVMEKLGGVLGIVATGIKIIAAVISFLISPLGMVLALVGALGGYLLWTSGAGGKALSWLGEKFIALKEFATKSFKGIADALAAGDIALAGKILWLSLKVIWLEGVQKLKELWVRVKQFAWETWYGIQAVWEEVVDAIVRALINGVAWMKEAWVGLCDLMKSGWESATDWIAKRFLEVQGLFDKDLDVKVAKEMIDVQAGENTRKRQAETSARLSAIDQEKKDRLAAAEQMHQDAMGKIGDELAAVQGKYDDELKASKDAVDAARREWEAALKQAADERAAVEGKEAEPAKPLKVPKFDLGPIMDDIKRTMSVRGTFNIAAIQGLMGGDAVERTADATEETAENTRRMLDQLDEMEGLAFE